MAYKYLQSMIKPNQFDFNCSIMIKIIIFYRFKMDLINFAC